MCACVGKNSEDSLVFFFFFKSHVISASWAEFVAVTANFRDYQEDGETKTETTYTYSESTLWIAVLLWVPAAAGPYSPVINTVATKLLFFVCLLSRHWVEIRADQQSELRWGNWTPEPKVLGVLCSVLRHFKRTCVCFLFNYFLWFSAPWRWRASQWWLLKSESDLSFCPKVPDVNHPPPPPAQNNRRCAVCPTLLIGCCVFNRPGGADK